MGDKSKIEWTEATWNPIRGCTRRSEGCRHCFAERQAGRFSAAGLPFQGFAERGKAGSRWTGRVEVVWPLIELPLRWRQPRLIFVNSMSDFFHEAVDQEELATLFAIMVAAVHVRGHTFQVLTKRADRMRWLLNQAQFWEQVNAEAGATVLEHVDPLDRRRGDARAACRDDYGPDNPPPGIWLGVSTEDQATADERIPHLLQTPAAVRFLSCEPLLAPINLEGIAAPRLPDEPPDDLGIVWKFDCLQVGDYYYFDGENGQPGDCGDGPYRQHRIDWMICGGESGPGARPMHPAWARALRDQCQNSGVPFFFKQWGEWLPTDQPGAGEHLGRNRRYLNSAGEECHGSLANAVVHRVGKRAAGAALDGREWHEMPSSPTTSTAQWHHLHPPGREPC